MRTLRQGRPTGMPVVTDVMVRLLVVAGVILAGVGAALLARLWGRPRHPPIDLGGIDLPPGIVLFTATTCGTCREARETVRATGIPVREVTYELEASTFHRAGVESVPLAVVIAPDGSVVARFSGAPPRRSLRRAVRRAGLSPG